MPALLLGLMVTLFNDTVWWLYFRHEKRLYKQALGEAYHRHFQLALDSHSPDEKE